LWDAILWRVEGSLTVNYLAEMWLIRPLPYIIS